VTFSVFESSSELPLVTTSLTTQRKQFH